MAGKLQSELKKTHPFDSAGREALLNLVRTSDQMQIRVGRLVRSFGLTPSQYNVLRILRGAGEPLPILEIAERTITVVPGITGLVDRLEQSGLVARARCERDRRVIYVSISSKARALLARMDAPLEALEERLMGGLTAAELGQLSRLLEKLREPLTANDELPASLRRPRS